MKKARIPVGVGILVVLLLLLLVRCSSDSSSDTPKPSADLGLIGQSCASPGEITAVNGASYVCVPVHREKETKPIYYGVAVAQDSVCDTPGKTRSSDGIFAVCSTGKDAKSRKWILTVPMPVAVTAFIDEGDSTEPGALEQVGVAIPDAIAKLPGMQEFAVPSESTTTTPAGEGSTSVQAPVTTTGPTDVATSTTLVDTTTTTPADEPTSSVPAGNQTTTSNVPTTTSPTENPTTTSNEATSTVPATATTTSTVAANKSCAEGGRCVDGDTGPGGGKVLVLTGTKGETTDIFEVAPVTWYAMPGNALVYTDRLVYGEKQDWRLPTPDELQRMATSRKLFTCPGQKRCALGFANSFYFWFDPVADSLQGYHLVDQTVDARNQLGAYVRPVRSILGAVG